MASANNGNSAEPKKVNDIARAKKPIPEPELAESPPVIQESISKSPMKQFKKLSQVVYIVPVILLIALAVSGAYIFSLRSDVLDLKKQAATVSQNPQAAVEQQTKTQVDKISKLMQLPTDEQPTVANVSNADQARKQSAFFNSAQNGDTVLMYVKSGQAILYRPSTNRIVLVAPLSFDQPTTSGTTSTTKR